MIAQTASGSSNKNIQYMNIIIIIAIAAFISRFLFYSWS